MLMMQSNWNSDNTAYGNWSGTAILEDSLAVSYKVKQLLYDTAT